MFQFHQLKSRFVIGAFHRVAEKIKCVECLEKHRIHSNCLMSYLLLFFLGFLSFRATPMAYGGSQARVKLEL